MELGEASFGLYGRTSLGQATGGTALRRMRPMVATMWCARRENQIS